MAAEIRRPEGPLSGVPYSQELVSCFSNVIIASGTVYVRRQQRRRRTKWWPNSS